MAVNAKGSPVSGVVAEIKRPNRVKHCQMTRPVSVEWIRCNTNGMDPLTKI